MGLQWFLDAKNSSGHQVLDIKYDDKQNEVHITLWGNLDGKYIQIDFDELSPQQFSEFYEWVNIIKNKILPTTCETCN